MKNKFWHGFAVGILSFVSLICLINSVQTARVDAKSEESCIAGYINIGVERSEIVAEDGKCYTK